jgi:hypothetical protein
MVGWNAISEMKLAEEPRLIGGLPPHHRQCPSLPQSMEPLFAGALNGLLQHNRLKAD